MSDGLALPGEGEPGSDEPATGYFYDNPAKWVDEVLGTLRAVVAEQGLEAQAELAGMIRVLDLLGRFIAEWNRRSLPEGVFPWEAQRQEINGDHLSHFLIVTRDVQDMALRLRDSGIREEELAKTPLSLERLSNLADEFLRGSASFILGNTVANPNELVQTVNSFRRELTDEVARIAIEASRDTAEEVLESIKEAAGTAGSSTIAQYFEVNAGKEESSANRLRLSVVACILGVVILAGYWTFFVEAAGPNELRDLAKLSLSIPLAALAVYLGRESTRHRAAADWSREIAIQLKTLEAYLAPLDDEQKVTIRATLGFRVFGGRVVPNSDDAAGVPTVSELGDFVAKIGEALRPSAK